MTFLDILTKFREEALSERDKGDKFEKLIVRWFLSDPIYAPQLSHVWQWSDFPGKEEFGGRDLGIDIVCRTNDGDYWAVQCKFYKDITITEQILSTFLGNSERQFTDPIDNIANTRFSCRIWVSTYDVWTSNADELIRNINPPFQKIDSYQLGESNVDWDALYTGTKIEKPKKLLRDHQKKALKEGHTLELPLLKRTLSVIKRADEFPRREHP